MFKTRLHIIYFFNLSSEKQKNYIMGDLLNYESDRTAIVELLEHGIHFSQHLLKDFNIRQGESFPVIVQSKESLIHMMKWGIENPIMDRGPELTYIYGPTIEKQESLKKLIQHQRVLIPVNKFVHHRLDQENDIVIRHPEHKVLWLAGIWYENKLGQKGFALITQNSIESKRNQIRRVPVFVMHKTFIRQWLSKGFTSMTELDMIMSVKAQPTVGTEYVDLVEF